jgi:hypothetical protein
MGRTHLTTLTMLFVATVGSLAGAQATTKKTAPPPPQKTTTTTGTTAIVATPAVAATSTPAAEAAPTDSAVPDSLKPKKKGRFGGFMNKAKDLANSKAGQQAQKIANNETVKGYATGVACTVVPGAAIASAATGKGPCQNAGLMAMMSGKTGGLGALTGLSNSAATAAAMQMMKNGTGYGVSNLTAAAAAAKMMQSNGLNNVAAMAAMKDAGMSGTDIAAAMKLMQSNSGEIAAAMKMFENGVTPPTPTPIATPAGKK